MQHLSYSNISRLRWHRWFDSIYAVKEGMSMEHQGRMVKAQPEKLNLSLGRVSHRACSDRNGHFRSFFRTREKQPSQTDVSCSIQCFPYSRSKVMAAPEQGEHFPHGHPRNAVFTVSSTNGPVCHPAVADTSKEPGNIAAWLSMCLGKTGLNDLA